MKNFQRADLLKVNRKIEIITERTPMNNLDPVAWPGRSPSYVHAASGQLPLASYRIASPSPRCQGALCEDPCVPRTPEFSGLAHVGSIQGSSGSRKSDLIKIFDRALFYLDTLLIELQKQQNVVSFSEAGGISAAYSTLKSAPKNFQALCLSVINHYVRQPLHVVSRKEGVRSWVRSSPHG